VGIAIYAVVVLRAIRFQYYLMPILPWVALMAGIGLDHLARRVPELLPRALRLYPQIAAVCLVGSLLAGGLFQIQGYWPPYLTWYQQGTTLDRTLPPGVTVILSGTFNPTLLYYARRHGYRVNPLTLSVLDADILGGASYLLDVGGISTCLAAYLNKTFPVQNVDGLRVYRLGTSPPPAPAALCSGGTAYGRPLWGTPGGQGVALGAGPGLCPGRTPEEREGPPSRLASNTSRRSTVVERGAVIPKRTCACGPCPCTETTVMATSSPIMIVSFTRRVSTSMLMPSLRLRRPAASGANRPCGRPRLLRHRPCRRSRHRIRTPVGGRIRWAG
jgi:hypothetical protein